MTRSPDIFTMLRSLDAADQDIDARGARARIELARIVATGPSGRPSRQPHPRRRGRTAWKVTLLGGTVVAGTAAVIVALPSIMGGDRAFASWTPTPHAMSAKERANAAGRCRQVQEDGAGRFDANELRHADAAIVERRGAWTTVVLATGKGFSATCITDDSTHLFRDSFGSIGTPAGYTPPGPRDLVATDLGTGIIDAGHLSIAAGIAGPEVAKVLYRSPAHGDVTATVSRGRFALWLPGDELAHAAKNGVEVEVTYRDGGTGTNRLHL
ncbi:hypothetical protein Airi01_032950 [Actinoallomurus iriomotensis]|uniref:Uncharacterized protein n=1 Tax=Actinoallomurus iriomotensis TaxID=478107 RepID=A0A9W6RFX0_9ACTN|nr:hypothetical protein Airi01_032950 [Actinoallomurus iriomotensis]